MQEAQERQFDGHEMVVVPSQTLAEMSDDLIASAERRIASIEKIIALALKITNIHDWVDQNGKPYLAASGAEKIGRLFGVSWKILGEPLKISSNDEKGVFYFYQVTGIFSLLKDTIHAIGTCSSKDQFFAKRGGEFKPISEIDETNILKAAYSNCVVNGVTRLLGIRNLTWEQVEASGLKRNTVAKVEYAAGGAGGGKISVAQQGRLFAILQLGADSKEEKTERETAIKTFIKEKFKIDSTADLGWKQYEEVCKKAEEIAMDFNER